MLVTTNFPLKCRLLFTSAVCIQMHFKYVFFMEAYNMSPDQTAPHIVYNIGYLRTQTDDGSR